MGLREQKAQRTRAAILEAALDLFGEHGFEQTTMDQIAACAEVGVATVYRYFATKEQVLLDPVVQSRGALAAKVAARPFEESIEESLGRALLEYLDEYDRDAERWLRLRDLLDRAPGPRARLWDVLAQERMLLEEAIAARTGAAADDLRVVISAHTTMMVLELAVDLRRSPARPVTSVDAARDILDVLASGRIVLPRLPAGPAGDREPAPK